MQELTVNIENVKSIDHFELALPLESGIYAIIGNNGTGKSTIINCMAQMIARNNSGTGLTADEGKINSCVKITCDERSATWRFKDGRWQTDEKPQDCLNFEGMYERSLFYGTRFNDSRIVDKKLKQKEILVDELVEADSYVKDQLSFILHGNFDHYRTLKRLTGEQRRKLRLKNTPYFYEVGGELISQYRMSSGECLLISLLHFINNAIVRMNYPEGVPVFMFIDEIEVALHPIAVSRLLDEITKMLKKAWLIVVLTSHSPEIIRKIKPRNIYHIEIISNGKRRLMVNNPCYPSYAIRDLYMHDGFDYVILVEDNLARLLVRHCIDKEKLSRSKLINIIPVGGWRNVLNLQNELFQSSSFGVGTKIFCVLDGDIKNDAVKSEKYQGYPKLFLPVSSVEKLLRDTVILDNEDNSDKLLPLRKELKDIFFIRRSLNEILADYHQDNKKNHTHDADGKKLYRAMIEELAKLNISEETFIERLAGLIENYFSFIKFEEQLRKMLS